MIRVNAEKERYEQQYDELIIPLELSEAHFKGAITKRNRWMIDRSDCLIAYVYRDFGGAYAMLQYAGKKNKEIFNLADTEKWADIEGGNTV